MDVQRCGASVARPPPTCLNGIALPWSTFGSLGTYFGVRYAGRPPGREHRLAMKKVKQSPRSDQPASCRSSKAAMRRSNVPRGHQEGAGKRRRQTRRRSRSRSDSAAAANARLSVLRAVPETGLRFVAQPRRHAGTGSRKGDSWTAERQSLFPPPGARLNANDAPAPAAKTQAAIPAASSRRPIPDNHPDGARLASSGGRQART